MPDYEFIRKALFFPGKGILVIGDLHIGYDFMLEQSGVLIPKRQVQEVILELKLIFEEIESRGQEVNTVVFLGDIKHSFSYNYEERDDFMEVLEFLGERLPPENIIFIKGNHDTVDYSLDTSMKDFHLEGNLAFAHGHESFPDIFDDKVETIVMGHLHPAVILSDQPKKEVFKAYLVGQHKGKEIIILPSFLEFTEGTPVNEFNQYFMDDFSIIPKKDLRNSRVFVVGEDRIYEFGKVKDFR
jgi:putative SbcD/Mre11-related phosphoesterase